MRTTGAVTQRPDQAFIDYLLDGAEHLAQPVAEPLTWCIYSPTDDDYVPIVVAWVDNDFDTMRSRSAEVTARTERVVILP